MLVIATQSLTIRMVRLAETAPYMLTLETVRVQNWVVDVVAPVTAPKGQRLARGEAESGCWFVLDLSDLDLSLADCSCWQVSRMSDWRES